jgi:hypothetical protein
MRGCRNDEAVTVATLSDAAGFLGAVAFAAALLALPGCLIGYACDSLGFRRASPTLKLALAPLLGLAILPGPLALVSTTLGLNAAAAALVGLAVCGLVSLQADASVGPSRSALVALAALTVAVMLVWIDIEWGGGLYQSLATVDMIKHAAITREIVEAGVTPPGDPFVARSGAAVFYYFYFVPAAVIAKLAAGAIDSRMAVGGMIVWTAVALLGLLVQLYRASGLRHPDTCAPLLAGLLGIAGVQIFTAIAAGAGQTNWSNTMITAFPVALVWVPHHVAGLLASFVALLLLTTAGDRGPRGQAIDVMLAGAALASAAGLSLWITIGTVGIVVVLGILALAARRTQDVARLFAAGIVGLCFAAPYLAHLLAGAGSDGSPLAFGVRSFVYAEKVADALAGLSLPASHTAINLLLLPFNYLHELGLLLAGGIAYWLHPAFRNKPRNDVARLLIVSAGVAFLFGSFARSTIGNNDFGWRVMMFAQIPLLLWTAHMLAIHGHRSVAPGLPLRAALARSPRLFSILGLLGATGVAYDLAMLRAHVIVPLDIQQTGPRHAVVDLDLRRAYHWLNALPRSHVVQHNPMVVRALPYALYGRHRTGIADMHNATLLGAPLQEAQRRLADVGPIFTNNLDAAAVKARATAHGISLLVIAANDPVWARAPDWLVKSKAVYRNTSVIVLDVDQLMPEKTS